MYQQDEINPLKHAFFSLSMVEIWFLWVFGVADYESELEIQKFQIVDLIFRTNMKKVIWLRWNLVFGGLRDRSLQIRAENSEIQNGGTYMVDQNLSRHYRFG